jgi:hypothetical protein
MASKLAAGAPSHNSKVSTQGWVVENSAQEKNSSTWTGSVATRDHVGAPQIGAEQRGRDAGWVGSRLHGVAIPRDIRIVAPWPPGAADCASAKFKQLDWPTRVQKNTYASRSPKITQSVRIELLTEF